MRSEDLKAANDRTKKNDASRIGSVSTNRRGGAQNEGRRRERQRRSRLTASTVPRQRVIASPQEIRVAEVELNLLLSFGSRRSQHSSLTRNQLGHDTRVESPVSRIVQHDDSLESYVGEGFGVWGGGRRRKDGEGDVGGNEGSERPDGGEGTEDVERSVGLGETVSEWEKSKVKEGRLEGREERRGEERDKCSREGEMESSRESDLPAVIVLASDNQDWRIGELGDEEMTEGSVGLDELSWEDL